MSNKVYLGDGVYIDYDESYIKLTTENGINATNTIYLEFQVLDNLFDYIQDKFPEYYQKRISK